MSRVEILCFIPVIPLDNNFDVISFVLGADESLEDDLTDVIDSVS